MMIKLFVIVTPVILGPFLFKWAGFYSGANWDNPSTYFIIISYIIGSVNLGYFR
jgi:hypothetical protein